MDFKTAVLTCLKEKYFNLNGRASRAEYWYFFLFVFVINFVFKLIGFVVPFIDTLVALALLLPTVSAGVRRFHDTNRSGLFMLIGLIPFIARYIPLIGFPISIIGSIILLVLLAQKGTDGDNTYGPNPL